MAKGLDLAAMAAEYGINLDPTTLRTTDEIKAANKKASRSDISAGTLLLDSLPYRQPPRMVRCVCNRTFMTNYTRDRFCSRECMIRDWEAHFHIKWDALTPPLTDWEQEEPFRVPPDAVDALYEWAKAFVSSYETDSVLLQNPEHTEPEETRQEDLDAAQAYSEDTSEPPERHPTPDDASLASPFEEPQTPEDPFLLDFDASPFDL